MQRPSIRLMALVSIFVTLIAATTWLGAAQEATPDAAATPAVVAGGEVTVESVGRVALGDGQRLEVFRVTLGPGASIPLHAHPGTGVLSVESGSISLATTEGETYLMGVAGGDEEVCAGGCKHVRTVAPDSVVEATGEIPTEAATAEPGVIVLKAGDALVETPSRDDPSTSVHHTYRAGADGAVVIISRVLSEGETQGDLPDACEPSRLSGRCLERAP